jgi:flagellar protein FliO/FliZ
MSQTIVTVAVFVLLLAMVPFGIKWLQTRSTGAASVFGAATRVVSAVAVGPQQRVVTVEVGPQDMRTWLVLGVTSQSITCLHSIVLRPESDSADESLRGSVASRS